MSFRDTIHPREPFMSNSQDSPRPTDILNGEIVFQRLLILHGAIPALSGHKGDGPRLVVHHKHASASPYPDLNFPVKEGVFKALVHLEIGENEITLEALPSKATTCLTVVRHDTPKNPPLRLVIVQGCDSPGTFDVAPGKEGPWGNDVHSAIARYRATAYLWQAFQAEQMYRHGYGRRTFPLEETVDPQHPDTLSVQDMSSGTHTTRRTAKVHLLRSRRTTAEIRHREHAQQWKKPEHGYTMETDGVSQFGIAHEILKEHPDFKDPCHVMCLTLDSHWNPATQLIEGHAALGGGAGHLRFGVFGSHCTHSWPRWLEEVETVFMDATPVDTRYLANDVGEAGEMWKAANIGMGAFLHEAGHMLTLMHTSAGIMSRGFNNYNRTFLPMEPRGKGVIPPTTKAEAGAHWHRTDAIRLRVHPSMALPGEKFDERDGEEAEEATLLPIPDGRLLFRCPKSGIASLEYWVNDRYRHHVEFPLPVASRTGWVKEVAVSLEQEVFPHLGSWNPGKDKLEAVLVAGAGEAINRFSGLEKPFSRFQVQIPPSCGGGPPIHAFLSDQLGQGKVKGTKPWEIHFGVGEGAPQSIPRLRKLVIRNGRFIDGLIFELEDPRTGQGMPPVIVGNPNGGHADELTFAPGEGIASLRVRCGWWIDGFQVVTTHGRSTPWMGGTGGGLRILEPPRGCVWCGIKGSGAGWLDAIQMIYCQAASN
ncbi:putative peptidase family-domain-containing protein [Piptocephalis cylindrospora]|uniref:Putative peptidase family-domain-containing protein n=1 Tax=Piptocephalis cylindrospora TaxID=1907219 RepID=A0A4P9Y4P6_9FUNG|nr:putative peptidase family-domain-containing protein [Piptocephalis cylindrospora]|eukprot:RKP13946.1 putative peptidase family-domain-containing protein [Piptocephalis cylindrospora]